MYPLIGVPQGWELVLIVLVIILVFGAKKLPELARGSGQALRIFKAETKGMRDDDEKAAPSSNAPEATPQREIDPPRDAHGRPIGQERNDGTTA